MGFRLGGKAWSSASACGSAGVLRLVWICCLWSAWYGRYGMECYPYSLLLLVRLGLRLVVLMVLICCLWVCRWIGWYGASMQQQQQPHFQQPLSRNRLCNLSLSNMVMFLFNINITIIFALLLSTTSPSTTSTSLPEDLAIGFN